MRRESRIWEASGHGRARDRDVWRYSPHPAGLIHAVLWYGSFQLSAVQGGALLAERGVPVSSRAVLTWVQAVGATAGVGAAWCAVAPCSPGRPAVRLPLARSVPCHRSVILA